MLDLDDDRAREAGRRPVLVELVGLLLLDPVVALELEALAVLRLQVRVRRHLAEAADRLGEVAVEDDERVARVGVLVEAERQEDVRAEEDVAPPELRQALAADALVLDVLRRGRLGNGRDHLVEDDRDRVRTRRVDLDLLRGAVQVAGREVPVLAFAAVHRQLDRVPVRAVERLVAVEDGLDEIRALRDAREALEGVAEDGRVEDDLLRRRRARSTSTPKICWVLRPTPTCIRGSSEPSVETMRRTRPSSGAALRSRGNETAKRRGACSGGGGRGAGGRPEGEEKSCGQGEPVSSHEPSVESGGRLTRTRGPSRFSALLLFTSRRGRRASCARRRRGKARRRT